MKIAQIIPTLDRSGAEKQMLLLCRELKRRGHDVQVAVLTRTGLLEQEFRDSGIEIKVIGKPLKVDPFALLRLSKWLKRGQFDVVQSWLFAANSYTRAACRIAFGAGNRDRPKIITTEMAVDLWKSQWHFKVDRYLARFCDTVVGNSDAVVAFYRDTVGIDPAKLTRIYSGIEISESGCISSEMQKSARQKLGITADQSPVILFAGRLAEQKRVEDLLKAADILQHLHPNMRVVIAGDGPLKTRLEEFSRLVDLGERALFTGHCTEMETLYAASDIVVLPSSYEGLPNVVMEAQLRGLPVVAAAAPGTVELVRNRETGLTYPVGDSTELARLLEELIANQELGKLLGDKAREMIGREFTVSLMADAFEQLYSR
jgi:glycosyltransferase involved in cell wall biosynthesis